VHTFVHLWALHQAAFAQGVRPGDDPSRAATGVHAGVAGSSTVVVGPVAADGETLNPALVFGLRPRLVVARGAWSLLAQWGVSRTQMLCDTCDGDPAARAQSRPLRTIDSDDLFTRVARRIGGDHVSAQLQGDLIAPASRDAFVCNPFYGAVGAGSTISVAAGDSLLLVSGSARRAFFRYDAVPVGHGACSRDLTTDIDTLSGPVQPTPYDGERSAGPNVAWSARAGVTWNNPHRLLTDSTRWFTSASLGVSTQRTHASETVLVDTLDGQVAVTDQRTPWVASVPASVQAGVNATDHLSLALGLSNAMPTLLADPGARVRMLPTTTALTLTADGHW